MRINHAKRFTPSHHHLLSLFHPWRAILNAGLGKCRGRWHRCRDGKSLVSPQRKRRETLSLQNPPATTDFQAPLVPVAAPLARALLPNGFFF